MSDSKDTDKVAADQADVTVDAPVKKRRRWPWVIVGIVVLAVIAYIPWYYTASPVACTKCHAMKPYYDSWKKSFHGENETSCNECHVRPGWFPYITYRIGFYSEIVAQMFDLKMAPWGATAPGESSCTRSSCHTMNRLNSPSGDIKVNHLIHYTKAHKKCSYCHAGASHAGVKGIGLQTPPRQQCFICHKDKASKCTYCHTSKYKDGTKTKKPHF